ncbi:LUD domain-containing protein [Sorangium sp. So ce693]|uniref:LUD domain-containing protein n=1 Tax=Sorangium sp. So ce693 TaxID=3133318 RepID=UPI003F5E4C31
MTAAPPRSTPGSSRPAPRPRRLAPGAKVTHGPRGAGEPPAAGSPSAAVRRGELEHGPRSRACDGPGARGARGVAGADAAARHLRGHAAAPRSPPRLGALARWIHVALVRRADIHRSLGAAISALGGDPYVVWCTGPSKTADVEGILIQGVHGPGEHIALIVDAW